ncbi:MAG: hypothetical protein WDN69_00135 [Aliidongia sp.]
MPFAIEGADASTGSDTPCNFALAVGCFRGVLDVTTYSDGGAANSFDLYLPTPSAAIGFSRSVNFSCGEKICGEARMIVFVGTWPTRRGFSSVEQG